MPGTHRPAVRFGLYLPQVGRDAEQLEQRALVAEALGFDSVWLFDHLYPPGQPEVGSFEGWTLATHLLARTTRLRVGHLVLSATFRHPALLAKMAATLDVLSGGRLELGLGSGSVAEEHRRAGMAWGTAAERADHLAEVLTVVDRLLRAPGPPAEGAGAGGAVADLPNLPPPVQRPRPPLHIGGVGPRTLALAARHADVWNLPTYGLGRWRAHHDAVDRACRDVGRDPGTLRRSHQAVLVLARDRSGLDEAMAVAGRRFAGDGWGVAAGGYVGTPDDVVRRVAEVAEAGVDLCIFLPHDRGTAATLELFAERVMPAFR